MGRILHAAGAVSALAYAGLALLSLREAVSPAVLVAASAGLWVVYFFLAARLRGGEPGWKAVLGWAALFRLIGLAARPLLEDDHFRFLWDGFVFAREGSPYARPPAAFFTDPAVPERMRDILDLVNNPFVPTIYGPVCELAFLGSYLLAAGSLWPWKLILLAAELGTLTLLARRLPARQVFLYAWCPLLIQETAFSAHPDALGLFFLTAALLCRLEGRGAAAAVSLALAGGVRIHALMLAPFLLRRPREWVLLAAVLLGLYAPFLGDGGGGAGLAVFLSRWEFNSSVFGLLAAAAGGPTARLLCGAAFGVFYAWFWVRQRKEAGVPRGDVLYGMLFLFSPVVNPWYLLWLLPFAAFHPSAWAFTAMAASGLSYLHGPDYLHAAWVRPAEYGLAAAALAWGWRRSQKAAAAEKPNWVF